MLDKKAVREIASQYTDLLCKTYAPKSIILFGSYINGNPHKYSDIDIAVVFDGIEGSRYEIWANLFLLRESISFDIEPHLMDENNDRSGFLDHIRKTGEVIYGAKNS